MPEGQQDDEKSECTYATLLYLANFTSLWLTHLTSQLESWQYRIEELCHVPHGRRYPTNQDSSYFV